MRLARRRNTVSLVLLLIVSLLPSCGAEQGEPIIDVSDDLSSAAEQPAEPVAVTVPQAGDAIADAMLAASSALYLALLSRADGEGVTSDDGAITLTWSEDADFATGVGSYVIVLDQFTVAEHTDFGPQAVGYTLSGTIMLKSEDGAHSSLLMDLAASHPEPDRYPVEDIAVELTGYMAESGAPRGYVRVNGIEMSFAEISGAFAVATSTTRGDPTE